MKELDLVAEYIELCEKCFPNSPYPHEIILMSSDEAFLKAIKEVKKLSNESYKFKVLNNRRLSRKGLYAKYYFFRGCDFVEVETKRIKDFSYKELYSLIKRIKMYKSKHPEKEYYKVLCKELDKRNKYLNDNTKILSQEIGFL